MSETSAKAPWVRRQAALAGALVLAGCLAGGAASAADPEVTLTVQHFLSPKAPAQTRLIEPWAQKIQEQSGGRIAVEIFPSMSLGGKPPELYSQVRDGVVDVVWTVIGYTPGTFPRAEVFELPTVHNGSAEQTNLAIQDVFDQYLAEDFGDVKPILVHVHSGNAIHTTEKKIASVEDLKGLKLRTPSRTGAWMIEAWEAEPVGMPVPELPQALSKNIIDGALIPFEVVLPLKVHELTQHSVEGPNGERFGSAVFLFAMNKERYEGLPDDLKKVIDDNSGAGIAGWVGENWDQVEVSVKDIVTKAGHSVETMDAAAIAEFEKRGETVVQRWIEDVSAQGIDGKALVEAARAAVASHTE